MCSGGGCALSCQSGLTECSNTCIDTDTDEAHCGGCIAPCATGELCSGGSCTLSCQSGLTNCGGTCVDLTSNRNYCNDCSTSCSNDELCNSGVCEVIVCSGCVGPSVFYVVDDQDNLAYTYDTTGALSGLFELWQGAGDQNDNAAGAALTDTYLYVLDKNKDRIYQYDLDGVFIAMSEILQQDNGAGLNAPRGLALFGDDLWLVQDNADKLLQYSLASLMGGGGAPISATLGVDLTVGNDKPEGLTMNDTYLYVLDKDDEVL